MEGTTTETIPQGTILRDIIGVNLTNHSHFSISGQTLDLDENDHDLEDPDEDPTTKEESERPPVKTKAKLTPKSYFQTERPNQIKRSYKTQSPRTKWNLPP